MEENTPEHSATIKTESQSKSLQSFWPHILDLPKIKREDQKSSESSQPKDPVPKLAPPPRRASTFYKYVAVEKNLPAIAAVEIVGTCRHRRTATLGMVERSLLLNCQRQPASRGTAAVSTGAKKQETAVGTHRQRSFSRV